ncbi:MAG TPA: ABC transporter substrate-binding protein [Gaiellaceae bacterium]|nr:ABC transporter substrate-binding protein [Gaiellaceae bacterium]
MKNRVVRGVALAAIAVPLALLAAGCGGSSNKSSSGNTTATSGSSSNSSVKGSVTFDGIWTGAEAQSFAKVIAAFNKQYPNVKIKYKPVGNNVPTVLATAIAGGHPPDMADIAQPGLVKQLAQQGHLKPITYAKSAISSNFAPVWQQLGTVNGTLYALVFKAANKSLLWYNVPAFKQAGVTAPKTFDSLLKDAQTLKQSGTPAYSVGGADGWTLTDLFENLYLRRWGQQKYQQLSAHQIKWTDPSVITTLKDMGKILGDTANLAGGRNGAIQNGFNDSVTNAFSTPPKGAMVFEGDFVAGVILSSTKAKPKTGFDATPFPSITPGANANAVEIGGDLFVTFRDTPAIRAFVNFLATAPAAEAWARLGGFGTGNKNVPASIYPDAITRATEAPIGKATAVVFDMSDEQPASFGSTTGQGEWGIFQDFLRNPADVNGTAQKLEKAASAAYKSGK